MLESQLLKYSIGNYWFNKFTENIIVQYVKTFEMRMFNEKFTKSSWQHSAQWNILHFPDVQYRADGQIKYRAYFGVLHTSFIDGVGSYEVWCALPHITVLVPEFPEERLIKFLSFLALVNSAAEDVKQVLNSFHLED